MKIIGKSLLLEYASVHPNARPSIEDWIVRVESQNFSTPQELKQNFPSVDFLPNNHCIFNINGNHHRLFLKVVYVAGSFVVKWIGTHAQYDKIDFTKLTEKDR